MVAVVAHAGLRATLIHRVGHWASMSGIPWLPTALSQLNLMLHGIELGPSVPIGPGLYMPHTTGSVVHARRIGSNVTLQGGITVGMRGVKEFFRQSATEWCSVPDAAFLAPLPSGNTRWWGLMLSLSRTYRCTPQPWACQRAVCGPGSDRRLGEGTVIRSGAATPPFYQRSTRACLR